jgi:hypothetical protein
MMYPVLMVRRPLMQSVTRGSPGLTSRAVAWIAEKVVTNAPNAPSSDSRTALGPTLGAAALRFS